MSYICKICGQTFDEIPADAIQVSGKRGIKLIRLQDGTAHILQNQKRKLGRNNAKN